MIISPFFTGIGFHYEGYGFPCEYRHNEQTDEREKYIKNYLPFMGQRNSIIKKDVPLDCLGVRKGEKNHAGERKLTQFECARYGNPEVSPYNIEECDQCDEDKQKSA